jgi:GTPase SAR1 family protein
MGKSSKKLVDSAPAPEFVVVGLESSGKTLLCRHLERSCQIANAKKKAATPPSLNATTVPSVGVELLDLSHRGRALPIREVGGCMQPLWPKYIAASAALIFVVDTSSAEGCSAAVTELLDVLRQTRGKRVLLFLNKRDASSALPEETVKLLFDLDALEAALAGRLSVVAGSALTGDGLTAVLDFCADCVVEMEEAEKEAKLAEEAAKVRAANREKEEAQTKRDMAAAEKAKAADEAAAAAAAGAIAAPSAEPPESSKKRGWGRK